MAKLFKKISKLIRLPFLGLILLYQKTLSPDHGVSKIFFPHGCCRFFPTCSEYAYGAIKKDGLLKGAFKSVWRILRCNPWSRGGADLP
ncbi:MAG: membrane protein insertion efficiency factor YidD [bacterium]|nr:membrane protein insertion efficiency factor YidD [bacterium]